MASSINTCDAVVPPGLPITVVATEDGGRWTSRCRPAPRGHGRVEPGLNPAALAAIQNLARERDVPAFALLRGWIVQRFAAEYNPLADAAAAVERLEADVRTFRKLTVS